MEVIDKDEYELDEGYFGPDGRARYTRQRLSQQHAKPTTNEELALLLTDQCPLCGGKLAGDNGKFCVKDQTWWQFKNGMSIPENIQEPEPKERAS